jgi:lysophospholipase L1-like esterase
MLVFNPGFCRLCFVLAQVLFAGGGFVMGVWAKVPWPAMLGLGLAVLSAMVAEMTPTSGKRVRQWTLAAAWAGTGAALVSFLFGKHLDFTFGAYCDRYFAALAWLIAVAVLPVGLSGTAESEAKACWSGLALAWAALGALFWLGATYLENDTAAFYFGLLLGLALLVSVKLRFRTGWLGAQVVNTLILLLVGLPLADWCLYGVNLPGQSPDVLKKYSSYTAAKENPAAFECWWAYYSEQFDKVCHELFLWDGDPLTVRPRPNAHGTLMHSAISMNSKGFRGVEIPENKGATYRIVALGESTTFGLTLEADDKPWPELLQELIRQRLRPVRPVEVINAGVPAIALPDNLRRFPEHILPLKPDMIISYHGINGFYMLDKAVPRTRGKPPPRFLLRPIMLLADVENRLKLRRYRRSFVAGASSPPAFADPLGTDYARAYRDLIATCLSNNIQLVLGNYSMAVNQQSRRDAVQFFQRGYPAVHDDILANTVHSSLVQNLAQQHPEVCLVDTHPHLDGEPDKFLDLVHLTQEGDRQLAENFFAGIKEKLEEDLTRTGLAKQQR